MRKILPLIVIALAVFTHIVTADQAVFWFDGNTTTVFMVSTQTTISTINATFSTIIDKTTTIYISSNAETVLITQKILIGNTSITKHLYFYCTYTSNPTNFIKVVQKTNATYPTTTFTWATTTERITIIGPTLGTQTITRTVIINNTEMTTKYTQYYPGGTLSYTETAAANTARKITINIKSPSPIVGKIEITSNPLTTVISGYINAIINGKKLNYIITGTNVFTVTITYGTETVTIIGNQDNYTLVGGNYTIAYNPTPTINAGGEYTIFPDPPFILYLNENVPFIINATQVKQNTTNAVEIFQFESANFIKFSTVSSTTVKLPPGAPGFLIEGTRITMSKNNIKVLGTLYTNEYVPNAPVNIIIPNIYNAQNVIALAASAAEYLNSFKPYTLYTVKIYAPIKIEKLDDNFTPFIVNNNTYGTVQKITITIIDNGTVTPLYEYTYAGATIVETYYNSTTTIVYATKLYAPTTAATIYTKTENTITITVTTKAPNLSGTYITTVLTNYLVTTIAKPTIFSAMKSEIITYKNKTVIDVEYTSPKITKLVNSVTDTIIIYLIAQPTSITIHPAQTTSNNTVLGFTITTTAPKDVQTATAKTLGIVLYIVTAALFLGLLYYAFCIVREDDEDAKKACIIRVILIAAAIVIIYVLSRILDWIAGG